MTSPLDSPALATAVREVERHVAANGWDQQPRLYALVETSALLQQEPQLAGQLGAAGGGSFTSIEQEDLPQGPLDEVLAGLGWSDEVNGCALVVEVVALPPEVEEQEPDEDATAWAAAHPDRTELRLAVAVLRDGTRASVLRVRAPEDSGGIDPLGNPLGETMEGGDIAAPLAEALLATLEPTG